MTSRPFIPAILIVSLLALAHVPSASAFPSFATGQAAVTVLGQSDFVTGTANTGGLSASSLSIPGRATFDSSGNLWVSDFSNNRVLRYSPPFYIGQAANLVIGQSDFVTGTANTGGLSASSISGPNGLAFDSSGNLWVGDKNNNRILRYSKGTGFTTHQAADLVIGQTGFTSSGSGTTSTTVNLPNGLAFDTSDNLWVFDSSNNRVLRYSKGTGFTNGQAADLVIGQSDFVTGTANTGGLSASSLSSPNIDAFDSSGNLWVADSNNNRALRYSPPFTTHQAANLVIGQSDFVTGTANTGGLSASSLNFPTQAFFDSSGNLWVTDGNNHRVLRYSAPFSTGQAANLVIGQSGFGTGTSGTSSTTLKNPNGAIFDSSGNLYVTDLNNNRMLAYQGPLTPTWSSSAGALNVVQSASTPSGTTATGLTFPLGFFSFAISGVGVGGSASITLTFPAGTYPVAQPVFWVKCTGGTCNKITPTAKTATSITFTLTDGVAGLDDDGVANGIITDQGGLGFTPSPGIPEYPLEPVPILALIGALTLFFLIRRRVR